MAYGHLFSDISLGGRGGTVLQTESLLAKIKSFALEIFQVLKEAHDGLPAELSSSSLEIEETLKLLKSILDAIIDIDMVSDDLLKNAFRQLGQIVDESRDLYQNWHPLASRVYLVLQTESLLAKIRSSAVEIFQVLKEAHDGLPADTALKRLRT